MFRVHMITILHDPQLIHIALYKVYTLMMDDWSLHDHWDKMWICCYSTTLNFWHIVHTVEWNCSMFAAPFSMAKQKVRDTAQQFEGLTEVTWIPS